MTKSLFTSSYRRLFSLNLNPKLFAACKSNYFGYLFLANRSWILPCHRTQTLFEILTITQHFHLSENNLHSVSLSLSRIHLTNSKGEKDVKMIAYSEQQWKGWRKTRRGKMSEKMKREEKLQSQQLNGDFTVRTWISSLWSRSIINNLQGNSICKKTWICSLHISWQQNVQRVLLTDVNTINCIWDRVGIDHVFP